MPDYVPMTQHHVRYTAVDLVAGSATDEKIERPDPIPVYARRLDAAGYYVYAEMTAGAPTLVGVRPVSAGIASDICIDCQSTTLATLGASLDIVVADAAEMLKPTVPEGATEEPVTAFKRSVTARHIAGRHGTVLPPAPEPECEPVVKPATRKATGR